jgi:hypothetical protein
MRGIAILRPVHGSGSYEGSYRVARCCTGTGAAPKIGEDRGGSLKAILVALSSDRLARVFRGLSCVLPGRRLSSELDLLVGGMDRWTG